MPCLGYTRAKRQKTAGWPPITNSFAPPTLELNDPKFHVAASLGASLLRTETPIPLNFILDAFPNLSVHPLSSESSADTGSGVQVVGLANVVADMQLADCGALTMSGEFIAHQLNNNLGLSNYEASLHPSVKAKTKQRREIPMWK